MPSAELERREIVGVPICGLMQANCTCKLAPGHEGPHVCESAICGGSWIWEGGRFRVVRWPAGGIFGGLLDALGFGGSDDDEEDDDDA